MRRLAWVVVALSLPVLAGCGGDDDDGEEAFCDRLADLQTVDETLEETESSDQLSAVAADLDALVEDAPEEIRPDVERLAEAFRGLVEALEGVDTDDPQALLGALFTEAAAADAQAIEEAQANLSRYASDVCGVELGDTDEDETTTSIVGEESTTSTTAAAESTTSTSVAG